MNIINKKQVLRSTIFSLVLLFTLSSFAQGLNKNQMYSVHEDQVKSTMIEEYEALSKELIAECKKHDVRGLKWVSATVSENRYLHLAPINKMADLDNDAFVELKEKMGDVAFQDLFSRINHCIETSVDYVLTLEHDLSYMPKGVTQTPDDKGFRKFFYLNATPENIVKLRGVIKAARGLYESNNSPIFYRIYRSGYGNIGNYFMIAIAEKDEAAFRDLQAENNALLGEDRQPVFDAAAKYISKLDVFSGTYNQELSYSPSQEQ